MNTNDFLFSSAEMNRLLLSPRPDFIGFGKRHLIQPTVIKDAFNFWNLLCIHYDLTSYFDVQLLYADEGGYEVFFDANISIVITKDFIFVTSKSSSFIIDEENINWNLFSDIFPPWN